MQGFDLANIPKMSTVAVAMSGGVDSSVTAAILKENGYNVIGITLDLYTKVKQKGIACKDAGVTPDARKVAEKLGIPHYVLDLSDEFATAVVMPFGASYQRGETPNPCVNCNRIIKFGKLLEYAMELGADYLATGHYIKWDNGIIAGQDAIRDQSYFLALVKKEAVAKLRFPLAYMTKDEVRRYAETKGLHVAKKPSSNDLCFVAEGKYKEVVETLVGKKLGTGNIVNKQGQILGKHEGIIGFTVGQRKGLNIGGNEKPYYVLALDYKTNEVVVGQREELKFHKVKIKNCNWQVEEDEIFDNTKPKFAKIRAKQPLIEVEITNLGKNEAEVTFKAEVTTAAAKGQLCGIYNKENKLLGGGYLV